MFQKTKCLLELLSFTEEHRSWFVGMRKYGTGTSIGIQNLADLDQLFCSVRIHIPVQS